MALDIAFARRAITTPAAITSASPIPVRGYVLLMPSRDKKGSRSSMTRHPLTRPSYESSLPTCTPSTVTEVSFSSRLHQARRRSCARRNRRPIIKLGNYLGGWDFSSPPLLENRNRRVKIEAETMGGKLGMDALRAVCSRRMQDGGGRRLTLGDLFSKEGVKEQRSPFHGWAIRHARNNFNSRNAEQYLSLNNRGPRYSASRVYSEN